MVFLFTLFISYAKEAQDDIKVITEIEKSGFVGETLTYNVNLLSKSADIADVRLIEAPHFPEDTKVINGIVRNSRPSVIEVKGKKYYCWNILKVFVVPSRAGKMKIGEGKFVVFKPIEKIINNSFWGPRRIIDYEEQTVVAPNCSFQVKALPNNKSGETFNKIVGDFDVESWFPPGKIYPGKEAYVIFKISGYGDLSQISLPDVYGLFGKGCRFKEMEQSENQVQREGKLFSELTLTCRFEPLEDEFEILPLCIGGFNGASGKYYRECSDSLLWTKDSKEKGSSQRPGEAMEI